jgi:hypothetical protein
MKARDDAMELVRGSGNIFADFGDPDAEAKQLKAQMAADIIRTLDARGLSVRGGAKWPGLTQPTSNAFATPTCPGSRSIDLCGSPTGSGASRR